MLRFVQPGLGRSFWLTWWATTGSSLGDGLRAVAFPLIAAGITRNPSAIAIVSAAGFLPWPVFGLIGGAVVDRTDRRRLMWRTDVLRALLVGGFALLVAASSASIAALATVSFLLGAAETFFDNAASAIVPMVVGDSAIERANSWILSTQTVMSTMLGAPIGGALFALGHWVPPAVDALTFAAAALLVALIAGSYHPRAGGAERTSIRRDIAIGLRWLIGHPLLRLLAVLLAVLNLTFAAAEAVLVLYALEVVHLATVGYGLLLTLVAVGGVAGTVLAPGAVRLLGRRTLLIGVSAVQPSMLLLVGLTSSRVAVVLAMLLTGLTTMAWNVVTISLRQRIVPAELLGRVTSSYRVIGLGAMPLGALLAGVLAKQYGLHAPYLVAGVLGLAAAAGCAPFLRLPD